jgi:hypothetical protein
MGDPVGFWRALIFQWVNPKSWIVSVSAAATYGAGHSAGPVVQATLMDLKPPSNRLCRKAPLATRRARAMGYTNAVVMSVGIAGWVRSGLATDHDQGGTK